MTDQPNQSSSNKVNQNLPERQRNPLAVTIVAIVIVGLIGIGLLRCWKVADKSQLTIWSISPEGIMGTQTHIIVVAPRNNTNLVKTTLDKAVQKIRDIEAMMSVHIKSSPLSQFNAAKPGEYKLPAEIVNLIVLSRKIHHQSDGTFDITCLPIINLWKQAARTGKLPSKEQIIQSRRASNWNQIIVNPLKNTITKQVETVSIDLGGIAKGFAVDQAIKIIKSAGIAGGMVEIGGDLRCFGTPPNSGGWEVKIQNPFDSSSTCATLLLTEAAVATSGDYNRFSIIAGKRFSHIVDPRTGMALPVGKVCSATVVSLPTNSAAVSGTLADAWATAISVLGAEKGIATINKISGLEAMIITGNPDDYHIYTSEGFLKLLKPNTKITLK